LRMTHASMLNLSFPIATHSSMLKLLFDHNTFHIC
jgi:hypothetical protein